MTLHEIQSYIDNRTEESIGLDYKAAGSLQNSDGKKKEISKDVSAMANSAGGRIIYGISEYQDSDKKHLPEKIDPVDLSKTSKEWLEQVISSNIQPRIDGLLITPVFITDSQAVFVVDIPQSGKCHQAKDNRYYKRFNFESVPMDDYEVKDILNRQVNPDLDVSFSLIYDYHTEPGIQPQQRCYLLCEVKNVGNILVQYLVVSAKIGDEFSVEQDGNAIEFKYTNAISQQYIPIQPELSMSLTKGSFSEYRIAGQPYKIRQEKTMDILWTAYADSAPPKKGKTTIETYIIDCARTENYERIGFRELNQYDRALPKNR